MTVTFTQSLEDQKVLRPEPAAPEQGGAAGAGSVPGGASLAPKREKVKGEARELTLEERIAEEEREAGLPLI